jgi:hypothetical protein
MSASDRSRAAGPAPYPQFKLTRTTIRLQSASIPSVSSEPNRAVDGAHSSTAAPLTHICARGSWLSPHVIRLRAGSFDQLLCYMCLIDAMRVGG